MFFTETLSRMRSSTTGLDRMNAQLHQRYIQGKKVHGRRKGQGDLGPLGF